MSAFDILFPVACGGIWIGEVVDVRITIGLASGLPGTTGACPEAALEKNPARVSKRKFARRFFSSGP